MKLFIKYMLAIFSIFCSHYRVKCAEQNLKNDFEFFLMQNHELNLHFNFDIFLPKNMFSSIVPKPSTTSTTENQNDLLNKQ